MSCEQFENRNGDVDVGVVRDMDGKRVAYVSPDDTRELKNGRIVEVLSQEAKANARLIAAAPDMLECLRAARDEFRQFMPTTAGDVLTRIEAAIARAEGRGEPE